LPDDVSDPIAKGGEVMPAMVKWSPFQELDSMERRIRRMFEEVGFAPTLLPAADIYETDDEFVVQLDVPGFEEKELEIEVSDHQLTVKGERTEAKERKEKAFRLRERLEREFERRFELPAEADTKQVKAKFEKGVLEVHAPKLAVSEPKKIEITKA
jgi:HSP20 family protein